MFYLTAQLIHFIYGYVAPVMQWSRYDVGLSPIFDFTLTGWSTRARTCSWKGCAATGWFDLDIHNTETLSKHTQKTSFHPCSSNIIAFLGNVKFRRVGRRIIVFHCWVCAWMKISPFICILTFNCSLDMSFLVARTTPVRFYLRCTRFNLSSVLQTFPLSRGASSVRRCGF